MQQPKNEQDRYGKALFTVFETSSVKVKAIRIRKADGKYNLRLHVENNGILEPPLEFPMDKLRTKILEIKNYSYPFGPIDISNIIVGINNKFLKLPVIPTLDAFDKIGWHYDENGNVDYWKSATGIDLQNNPLVKDVYATYPSYAGDLQESIDYINDYISKHNAVAQSIILYGFSAVLAGYFQKKLLLSIFGKSSIGKTIISKLVISLFAEPENEKLSTTFNVTTNRMVERLNGINGAAVLIDDLSLAPPSVKKDIEGMVYVLENGREKERMRTKSFDRDPGIWFTTIIFSAEESILALCNSEHEGAVGRLMELNIGRDDLFPETDEPNQVAAFSHKHYGLLADEFVKRLISNNKLKDLANLYEQEKKNVRGNRSGPMARLTEDIAIITLCGQLLNQLFTFKFDIDAVKNYLITVADENIEHFKIPQKENIIIKTVYPKLIEYAKVACPTENEYLKAKGKDYVVISSQAAKAILTEIKTKFDYKPIDVKRALKDNDLLMSTDGAFSYNGTINNKTFRGLCIKVKNTEDAPNNE